jgi:HAD superfamily hydrolase (TIGR01484 family)
MYFHALATDYDGTIAHDGGVDAPTVEALERLRQSGRRLILVTGRERPDLERVFDRLDLFDLAVLENGGLLLEPASGNEIPLSPAPPEGFVRRLKELGVAPLSVGRGIVATWEPNETLVLEAIRELGLELQITFNKGAVMVLPTGINKASGLEAALARLGLSAHNVVGVGDAENDHAFLRLCGCAVAVANALPAVKETADLVTEGARGAGVTELASLLLDDDLAAVRAASPRHSIPIGTGEAGDDLRVSAAGGAVLIAGISGGGKSTLVTAMLESLAERAFQFCVIDPEGDYAELEDVVVLGDGKSPPRLAELLDLLRPPRESAVANLLGLEVAERPGFLGKLLPQLATLRGETGRPHWLVIDEAHHMLPKEWTPAALTLPHELTACILVTVHPAAVAGAALDMVDTVIAVGSDPVGTIVELCEAAGLEVPELPAPVALDKEEALLWRPRAADPPQLMHKAAPRQKLRRHARKYSEGVLGPDRSFFFRGPEGALNLRAHNLLLFMQMGDGVDDATWLHHLRRGDYSRWVREAIKDDGLADEIAAVEAAAPEDAATSRAALREAIERRYTAPTEAPGR